MKPITGGPIKKPRKLIDDTAANATPGVIFFDLPARLYTIGTTDDTPIPTSKNPTVAAMILGNITESISPEKMEMPLNFKMRVTPYFITSQSAANRPLAIVHINDTKPR